MTVETLSPEETYILGERLGKAASPGDIFSLVGDLGVGKTVFTQGFAHGLGIEGPVNSPTFTILQIYEDGRLPLYHFDVYRIEDPDEMEEIGYEEFFFGEGVCIVEWADRIRELLPGNCREVKIEKNLDKGFEYRRITISNEDFGYREFGSGRQCCGHRG
ncbi:MAG: tRNA (adenosine(37)-N6)-threonylcarbamoyltransferase complex ATPase subunit type 1 TsaE [Clostridiales bacterium]|nr:tRNA (adenosine(37)-N6)-threonylcarbamoyltransferase complex ATPase subunit type 1 TsaE [Clostridiales bacterium]